ncbi:MAG: hypothetical protein ACYTG7_15225 [Planctomycetota bacterium]|jgi:hypothetical protein
MLHSSIVHSFRECKKPTPTGPPQGWGMDPDSRPAPGCHRSVDRIFKPFVLRAEVNPMILRFPPGYIDRIFPSANI